MIQSNGFALFRGAGAGARAEEAASRVRRYADEVLVSGGTELGGPSRAKEVVLVYSLGGRGLPVVHGCERERALLELGPSGFRAERDALGTRGLWVVEKGKGAGSLASDYRLLPRGARLVPAGSTIPAEGAAKTRSRRGATRRVGFEEAAGELAALLEKTVRERVAGRRRVAVSFSGGLDSSLLAMVASRQTEVVLCSAFAAGSRDERQAERAAGLLGLRLFTSVIDVETMARTRREAELPPGEATAMDYALWAIYSATSALAAENGARTIILGQLADELFGGYMKYSEAARESGPRAAERMMREDVRGCARRGFLRDEAACSACCEVRFPYADARMASLAQGLPLTYKIRDGERKAVLRAAALELGLPEELASAPKKAAQFSSGAAKLLKRT